MASDRLTQLQDAVNFQAENFCNSIGILQQVASGTTFPEFEKLMQNGNTPLPQETASLAQVVANRPTPMSAPPVPQPIGIASTSTTTVSSVPLGLPPLKEGPSGMAQSKMQTIQLVSSTF